MICTLTPLSDVSHSKPQPSVLPARALLFRGRDVEIWLSEEYAETRSITQDLNGTIRIQLTYIYDYVKLLQAQRLARNPLLVSVIEVTDWNAAMARARGGMYLCRVESSLAARPLAGRVDLTERAATHGICFS
jgi:hypothetical protein